MTSKTGIALSSQSRSWNHSQGYHTASPLCVRRNVRSSGKPEVAHRQRHNRPRPARHLPRSSQAANQHLPWHARGAPPSVRTPETPRTTAGVPAVRRRASATLRLQPVRAVHLERRPGRGRLAHPARAVGVVPDPAGARHRVLARDADPALCVRVARTLLRVRTPRALRLWRAARAPTPRPSSSVRRLWLPERCRCAQRLLRPLPVISVHDGRRCSARRASAAGVQIGTRAGGL
jgi:hypothetical protein